MTPKLVPYELQNIVLTNLPGRSTKAQALHPILLSIQRLRIDKRKSPWANEDHSCTKRPSH